MIILFLNLFIFKNLWSILNFSESLLCSLFENGKVNIFRVSAYCLFSSFWRHRSRPSSLSGLASLELSSLYCRHSAVVCSLQGEPSVVSLWLCAWWASQTTFSSLWGGSLSSSANRAPGGDRKTGEGRWAPSFLLPCCFSQGWSHRFPSRELWFQLSAIHTSSGSLTGPQRFQC